MSKETVNKLKIFSFKKGDFKGSILPALAGAVGGAVGGTIGATVGAGIGSAIIGEEVPTVFEVQINPENFSQTYTAQHNQPCVTGKPSVVTQFAGIGAQKLTLKFTIDGTGTVANNSFLPDPAQFISSAVGQLFGDDNLAYVTLKVMNLKLAVLDFDGSTHRSPFVMVVWGNQLFKGVATSLGVNYTLFHPSGAPLRAEITLDLSQHEDSETEEAKLNLQSPDLTHERTVVAGDSILTLTNRMYDTPFYYLEVAKANRLNNFRKLKPGSRMIFPPIEKR